MLETLTDIDYALEHDETGLIASPVLDKGGVRLVDWMGSDLSVVNAARASYGKRSEVLSDRDAKLIRFLASGGHSSPFRHAFLTFEIKAPLMVCRQHWKYVVGSDHTLDSWNEASGRYITKQDEFYVVDPDSWRSAPANMKQGSGPNLPYGEGVFLTAQLEEFYDYAEELYNRALKAGVAPEQARVFLPGNATYTFYRWSCSLQSIAHFLAQRLDDSAQHEITAYAKVMYDMAVAKFPVTIEALVNNA